MIRYSPHGHPHSQGRPTVRLHRGRGPIGPQALERSLSGRELLAANGYQGFSDFPCIPAGASDAELAEFEKRLVGAAFPDEYRAFLKMSRYLKVDDGIEIGGLDHEGVYVTEVPWVSEQHRTGEKYLVFANYWRYADGDQLMFDLSGPSQPVVAYLHEHGPLFEDYAPHSPSRCGNWPTRRMATGNNQTLQWTGPASSVLVK